MPCATANYHLNASVKLTHTQDKVPSRKLNKTNVQLKTISSTHIGRWSLSLVFVCLLFRVFILSQIKMGKRTHTFIQLSIKSMHNTLSMAVVSRRRFPSSTCTNYNTVGIYMQVNLNVTPCVSFQHAWIAHAMWHTLPPTSYWQESTVARFLV